MTKGKLPDFIIAGCQKCGTTALRHNLSKHISLSFADPNVDKLNKEINFFRLGGENTFSRGVNWYTSLFKNDGNCWGESSPNYSFEPEVTSTKMHELHPSVKLIFAIRNPIDRAYSAYNHYMQVRPKSESWGNWLPDESFVTNVERESAFSTYDYCSILGSYMKLFPRNQIHIVIQEQLLESPQNEFERIFNFLEVEPCNIENTKVHCRKKKFELTKTERRYLSGFFEENVSDLYDLLGTKIPVWGDWC